MKNILFLLLISFSIAKAQMVFIGSDANEKLFITSGTSFFTQGLTITPSVDFIFSNNKISFINTPSNTIGSAINRSYLFSSVTNAFTGGLKITYQDSELNDETESDLNLVLFSENQWDNQTTSESSTVSNFILANVSNKSFNEITLNSNSAPTDIKLSSSSVNENLTSGTIVGSLSTIDSDIGSTHTYTLVSGSGDMDNSSFSINGNNLLTEVAFDYETKNSYSIVIRSTDGISSYSKTFIISVVDVDEDTDGDGITNSKDNCPMIANNNQLDTDGDGFGDVCDSDDDGDGVEDYLDNCPLTYNIYQIDTDGDGIDDSCDLDADDDTYLDAQDAFPLDATEWLDTDLDGTGNNADTDDDNDEYLDTDEIACESDPLDPSSLPLDNDGDLSPDCIDDNDDNDYCLDIEDDFALNKDLCKDCDNDQIDDRYEIDKDNDGVLDNLDAFPCDPNESQDTDGDGIGNNEDQDDNNDGFPDENLIISQVVTPYETGLESTWKIINIDQYPNTQVKIYAPDGSLVYESNNYQNDWAGTNISNGNSLPTGPYYFRVLATGIKVKEGWLYIFN